MVLSDTHEATQLLVGVVLIIDEPDFALFVYSLTGE